MFIIGATVTLNYTCEDKPESVCSIDQDEKGKETPWNSGPIDGLCNRFC